MQRLEGEEEEEDNYINTIDKAVLLNPFLSMNIFIMLGGKLFSVYNLKEKACREKDL